MMQKSAGLLVFRTRDNFIQVFLVHPGGPFWKGKDEGAWSIPKGEFNEDEEPLTAAKREFAEETGQTVDGEFTELVTVQQKSGKLVYAWAVESEVDAEKVVSNAFQMEYPYKSGRYIMVPEVDKGGWFSIDEARRKINPAQSALLDDLLAKRSP